MGFNKIDDPDGFNILKNALGDLTDILSIKPVAKYMSGARAIVRINGKIAFFAMNISWNIETVATEIRTIDEYLPIELAPRFITVTGTLGGLMIPGEGPSKNFFQSDVLNFMQQRYITIEVRDTQSDNLLFFTNKAMVTSRSESLNSGQLGRIVLNWKAVGWKDDREPKEPKEML